GGCGVRRSASAGRRGGRCRTVYTTSRTASAVPTTRKTTIEVRRGFVVVTAGSPPSSSIEPPGARVGGDLFGRQDLPLKEALLGDGHDRGADIAPHPPRRPELELPRHHHLPLDRPLDDQIVGGDVAANRRVRLDDDRSRGHDIPLDAAAQADVVLGHDLADQRDVPIDQGRAAGVIILWLYL